MNFENKNDLELKPNGRLQISKGIQAGMNEIEGNPDFKAQFDIDVKLEFQNGMVRVLPSALPANLQTDIPFYLFGITDLFSGFSQARLNTPPTGAWRFSSVQINGFGAAITPVFHTIKPGDIYLRFTDGLGNFANIIITCKQVSYISLLLSTISDLVRTNMFRYIVDPAFIFQLTRVLFISNQSIFGKQNDDKVSPQVYITNDYFNRNIADIPLELTLNKDVLVSSYLDYRTERLNFNITVEKLKQNKF